MDAQNFNREPIVEDLTHTVVEYTCYVCGKTYPNVYSQVPGAQEIHMYEEDDGWICHDCGMTRDYNAFLDSQG